MWTPRHLVAYRALVRRREKKGTRPGAEKGRYVGKAEKIPRGDSRGDYSVPLTRAKELPHEMRRAPVASASDVFDRREGFPGEGRKDFAVALKEITQSVFCFVLLIAVGLTFFGLYKVLAASISERGDVFVEARALDASLQDAAARFPEDTKQENIIVQIHLFDSSDDAARAGGNVYVTEKWLAHVYKQKDDGTVMRFGDVPVSERQSDGTLDVYFLADQENPIAKFPLGVLPGGANEQHGQMNMKVYSSFTSTLKWRHFTSGYPFDKDILDTETIWRLPVGYFYVKEGLAERVEGVTTDAAHDTDVAADPSVNSPIRSESAVSIVAGHVLDFKGKFRVLSNTVDGGDWRIKRVRAADEIWLLGLFASIPLLVVVGLILFLPRKRRLTGPEMCAVALTILPLESVLSPKFANGPTALGMYLLLQILFFALYWTVSQMHLWLTIRRGQSGRSFSDVIDVRLHHRDTASAPSSK